MMAAEEMTTIRKEGGPDDTADVVVQISSDNSVASADVKYFAVKVCNIYGIQYFTDTLATGEHDRRSSFNG